MLIAGLALVSCPMGMLRRGIDHVHLEGVRSPIGDVVPVPLWNENRPIVQHRFVVGQI